MSRTPVASSGPHRACLRATPDGCELLVQVVPNASKDACAGMHDDALRVRLAAPAIEGRANARLVAWLAASIGLPRRAVEIRSGEQGRRKRLLLACEIATVEAWLDRELGDGSGPGAGG